MMKRWRMIHQARQFYPLSDVLWMEYRLLPADATLPQRAAALLDLLRSIPRSLRRYSIWRTCSRSPACTRRPPSGIAAPIPSQSDVSRRESAAWPGGHGKSLPDRPAPNLHAAQRAAGGPTIVSRFSRCMVFETDDPAIKHHSRAVALARNVVSKGLDSIAARLRTSASTQPSAPTTNPSIATTGPSAPATASSTDTDPMALAALAKSSHDPSLLNELVRALSDRIWLELYYANNPAAVTPMLDALATLLPADDVTLLRLQGWYALAPPTPMRRARSSRRLPARILFRFWVCTRSKRRTTSPRPPRSARSSWLSRRPGCSMRLSFRR